LVGDEVRVTEHDLPEDPEEASDIATEQALRNLLEHLGGSPPVWGER